MTVFSLLNILPTKDFHLFKTAVYNLRTQAYAASLVASHSDVSKKLLSQAKAMKRQLFLENINSDATLERYYERVLSEERLALALGNPPTDDVDFKDDNEPAAQIDEPEIAPLPPIPITVKEMEFFTNFGIDAELELLTAKKMVRVYQVIPVGERGNSSHFGLVQFMPPLNNGHAAKTDTQFESREAELRTLFQQQLQQTFNFADLAHFLNLLNIKNSHLAGVIPFDAQLAAINNGKHQQLAMLVEFIVPVKQLSLRIIRNGINDVAVYTLHDLNLSQQHILSIRPLAVKEYLNRGCCFKPSHLYELDYWPNESFVLKSRACLQLQQQALAVNRHSFYHEASSSSSLEPSPALSAEPDKPPGQ